MDEEALYGYAVRVLSGRAVSSGELRVKLRDRAAEPGLVDAVISRLKNIGFLDDARFAESYAAARRDNQGLGRFRVAQDLKKRRVAPAVADKAAAEAYSEVDERDMARQFVDRKFRGKDMSDEKTLASAYRRLRTAGFGSGTAISVLKEFSARAVELEDAEEPPEA